MPTYIQITATGLLLCGLSACGGGGSSSATTAVDPSVLTSLSLTGTNAATVSGEVSTLSDTVVDVGDTGSGVVAGVVVTTADRPALSEVARWSLMKLNDMRGQLAPSLPGVVNDSVVDCTGSGTFSLSWDDADSDTDFSSGDSFSIDFSNCSEMGVTMHGVLAMSNLTLVGDPNVDTVWSMAATLTFTALNVTDGTTSQEIDGNMAFDMSTLNGDSIDTDISGGRLALSDGVYTNTLRNYSIRYTENINTTLYTLRYNGTLDIGHLNGRVTFRTVTPFTGSDILNAWPTAGSLLITGANNSSVTITAIGNDDLILDLDSNGDGSTDQYINKTWAQIH